MARPLRFQYPGAVYHVMARGDGGKRIFIGKEDPESFVHWLGRGCQSHGWRVHAWGLMGMNNDWLANRLCMGHPAAMSQVVNRMRNAPETLRILKKHEKTYKSKD